MRGKPRLILIEWGVFPIANLFARDRVQLVDTLFTRNTADRPVREYDEQRNKHGPGPIRDRIDTEVELLRQQHQFDGHMWHTFPIVLIEQGQRDFGKHVGLQDPAHR